MDHLRGASLKRLPFITAVNALQAVIGLLFAGLAIYLVALTRSPETLGVPDASDTVHGLLIGAMVIGLPALTILIGVWGLWKGRLWGWILSTATDLGVLAVLVYDVIDDNTVDSDEIVLATGLAVPIVLLLLPGVRRFYWNATSNIKLPT